MSATDAAIQKKVHCYGTKTVKFSNKDLDDMTKIVKVLEDSHVLMKGVTKALKNGIKKSLILMILGTLGTEECTELVITDKDYLEQDKGLKKNH